MKKPKKTAKIVVKPSPMSISAPTQSIYDMDFFKWTETQADLLRNEAFDKVDMENLIEEIESLGRSEKNTLRSHLANFFMHLLKVDYQPDKHTRSWDLSIRNAKHKSNITLRDNPSLKSKLTEIIEDAYISARLDAAKETGLKLEKFPEECPWDVLKILKEDT